MINAKASRLLRLYHTRFPGYKLAITPTILRDYHTAVEISQDPARPIPGVYRVDNCRIGSEGEVAHMENSTADVLMNSLSPDFGQGMLTNSFQATTVTYKRKQLAVGGGRDGGRATNQGRGGLYILHG